MREQGDANLPDISPALLSALLLGVTLALFAWDKLRHDLVALTALLAAVIMGLVTPQEAFAGFGDSAVITVAAVLVLGRAVELSGAAAYFVRVLTPGKAPLPVKLAVVMAGGMLLSAFMNNIAALAITMPVMARLCRDAGVSPGIGLMPLSFATILGGMTTLIGTPANLILSNVRQETLGAPFGFFAMTPVGGAVTAAGLIYLIFVGWRLAPRRETDAAEPEAEEPMRVFEVVVTSESVRRYDQLAESMREAGVSMLALWRDHKRVSIGQDDLTQPGDHLIVSARADPWVAAKKLGLRYEVGRSEASDAVTSRAVVGHGSPLIGRSYGSVDAETDGEVRVVAGGPRMARTRRPLRVMTFEPGDEIYLQGSADMLGAYGRYARLLELDRKLAVMRAPRQALAVVAIYVAAVLATALGGVPPAISFVAAAAVVAALRFIPAIEIYRAVDWPVIVLLGAMIPVGRSFGDTGASALAAEWLSAWLGHASLFWALAGMTLATALFSMFLNNVATAIVMGPVAIQAAQALDCPPDAFLLAVLIGASSDFLTPIGHQNNMLVMGPGGYKFLDYTRLGAVMMVIVVLTTAFVLSRAYG